MKLIFGLLLALNLSSTHASYPEMFGSSPITQALGGQASDAINSAANLYYAPALSAWSPNANLSLMTGQVTPDFKPIKGITVQNGTNSNSGTASGDALDDYHNYLGWGANLTLPVRLKAPGTLGMSYYSPLGKVIESDTGHPQLPEYVMYRARYKRTQIHLNYAHPFNERWAMSLGVHVGFQSTAKISTSISLGDEYGSLGSARLEVKPSLGAIASVAYKAPTWHSYLTYQQEMKTQLESQAFGDITDPPLTVINIGIETMMYYDPHIFRAGYIKKWSSLSLISSLEYQIWDQYKSPSVRIQNLGGSVRASTQYENIKIKNVLIPRLGATWRISDPLSWHLGAAYKPSPIKSNFSGAGNSIDSNATLLSTGVTYRFKLFDTDLAASLSGQWHKLEEKTVTKTAGQENGNSGQKIGAPGYTIGGNIYTFTTGLQVKF